MAPLDPPHILIFEPDPHGHTSEWVEHLCHFAEDERADWLVTFAVAPDLAHRLSQVLSMAVRKRIRVLTLRPHEMRLCLHSSLPISGFSRWWVMRRYLKQAGADHGVFLSIDHLSLPLALGLRMEGKSVSGILFRPSTHYSELTPNFSATLKEHIRDFRKRILYRLMLRNRSLHKMLSLDPYFSSYASRNYKLGDKVETIDDPAFPFPVVADAHANIPTGRSVFLLFGALAARKGILTLLAALREIDAETAQRIAVIIAGRVDPSICVTVNGAVSNLRRDRPTLWLELDDRRLPMNELANLIRSSDVILAPYQRFVGSSGVLLWAASAGKPVITQNYGLLGKLCQRHGLGLSIDTTDPSRLARAIESMSKDPAENFNAVEAESFVESRTPRHFAATLFGATPVIAPSNMAESAPAFRPRTGHAFPFR
ncbi:MAG TPA: glycosyltransferase [Parvibaculum sp.]